MEACGWKLIEKMDKNWNIKLTLDNILLLLRGNTILTVYWIFMAAVCVCYGEESVFLTVLNNRQLRSDDNPSFQCYQTTTTSRTYGRYADTRSVTSPANTLNLPPYSPQGHCCEANAQVTRLQTQDKNGYGIFYCQGAQPNKAVSTVPTIFLRSAARLHPLDGFFTKTVNVGDQDVTLGVVQANGHTSTKSIEWRFNDSAVITQSTGFTHTISGPVSEANEGVYEAVYAGERDEANGALQRLIVRGCPANRWGAPNCHGICDNCYNGGVCDDKSGMCICPTGFRGTNCLTACGGNSYGENCEFKCSKVNDVPSACLVPTFCLPDPYGCTCNTGYYTLGCQVSCPSSNFGAGCTEDCHTTTGTCDPYTGAPNAGSACEAGWSGDSCQIPDVCESDYYGPSCTEKCHCLNGVACNKVSGECPNMQCAPGYNVYSNGVNCQECRGSTFGYGCTEVCHCDTNSCNKVTGECNGNCLTNWVSPDCKTGIESLTNTKVNPNQRSTFTCRVTGNPVPPRDSVILERAGGSTSGISFKSELAVDDKRDVLFEVNTISHMEIIRCRIMGRDAYNLIQANTYVLPELSTSPRAVEVRGLSVVIEWDAWNNVTNIGDAPVVAYRVHHKPLISNTWTSMDITGNGLSTTIIGLRWETRYLFSISAVRAGIGGEGPRGPNSDVVVTTCAEPLPPVGLVPTTDPSIPKQITLRWQLPNEDSIRCSSGLTRFNVYYRNQNERTDQTITTGAGVSSANLTGLETFKDYMITMTMSNSRGMSGKSEAVHYYSPEEAPPAPLKANISTTTSSSVGLLLRASEPYNLNGVIRSYEIEYQMISPIRDEKEIRSVMVMNGEHAVTVMLSNLTIDSNYSIRVHIENGVGISPWSDPVYALIVNSEAKKQTGGLGVGGTVGVVISLLLLILLIAVFIVVVLRRRESQKKVPPISYLGSVHGETNANFADNSVIDLTVPERPRKDKHSNDNMEENMYANAAIINNVNENGKAYKQRPPQELPTAAEESKDTEPIIPVAAVKPSLKGSLPRTKQGAGAEEQTMYENVIMQHQPIPVEELEIYVKQRKKIGSWKDEYSRIPKENTKSWEVASKPENKPKNRFKNIIPYDHSRVVLEPIAGDPHSDYYNACYIKNHKDEKAFIAAQGPNAASLNDFWRMIWQENVGTIVMVTQLVENGKEKCKKYWPETDGHTEMFGNLEVKLLDTEFFCDYSIRTLKLQQVNGEESRSLKQYSFFSWPDMGVPLYPTAVLQFVHGVKREYQMQQVHYGKVTPILVHCSAGVGRTGTFISIYTQLEMMDSKATIDVFNYVKKMRESRINMVQTAEQYMFVYNSLLEAHLSGNTAISVNEYSEVLDRMKRINRLTRCTYIEEEYKTLVTISPLPDIEMFKSARQQENSDKNRYSHILPLERNRPFLIVEGTQGSTNYINAVFVDSFKKKDAFITTQMPLPNTVGDIWRMVWDWKCCAIVMLNEVDETDSSCIQYWPEDYNNMTFGPLVVDSESSESNDYFITRKLRLTNINEPSSPVILQHFQLQSWPSNQDKPDSPLSLLSLLDAVENWQKEAACKGPVIVQCMNGIGRSGVFCTISTVREKLKRDNVVDIFQSIKRLRMNHPQMIESLDQYTLCYETMQEFFTQFDDYANFR